MNEKTNKLKAVVTTNAEMISDLAQYIREDIDEEDWNYLAYIRLERIKAMCNEVCDKINAYEMEIENGTL